MPSAEKESNTRPYWSYYNPNEIKGLYAWLRDSGVDFALGKGVEFNCD
jgi:hypothetical protein